MKFIKFSMLLFCFLILQQSVFTQETINFRKYVETALKGKVQNTIENGKVVATRQIYLKDVCNIDEDDVAKRIFADYGAIFVTAFNNDFIRFPAKCIFQTPQEALTYQQKANPIVYTLGGVQITLQKPAMDALLAAVKEAGQKNLRITPRGGSNAASRSYEDTVRLWNSRFLPGLNHWISKGRIKREDAEVVKKMENINDQVAQVLEWESQKLWFSTDFSKSILYSVAAPGASQHIFMLALDVEQFSNKQVREILAKHGWFQTVQSDLPHFTYIGAQRDELGNYGLVRKVVGGQEFWIPNL